MQPDQYRVSGQRLFIVACGISEVGHRPVDPFPPGAAGDGGGNHRFGLGQAAGGDRMLRLGQAIDGRRRRRGSGEEQQAEHQASGWLRFTQSRPRRIVSGPGRASLAIQIPSLAASRRAACSVASE